MRPEPELDQRQRDILGALVRTYIAQGAPVGSKALADRLAETLSSATVRNVMVDLEAEGYLEQPHISAGRVPTDKAYRFFVDKMVCSPRLAPAAERYIVESLKAGFSAPEELMAKASHVLSEVSHNVGLVLGPALEEKLLEHIKIVKLDDRRILVVIVSRPDLVENKVVHLEEDYSQEDLDHTANYLNTEFRGWSLRTIRLEISKRVEAERIIYHRLLESVALLFMRSALASEEPGLLYMEGTSNILDQPEFEDAKRVRELLAALEEKAKLIKILTACLDTSGAGVRILIGRENPEKRMHQCAFVVAPLHYRNRAVGALGVVGPTRMEYERAITAVNYVAHLCSKLLSAN